MAVRKASRIREFGEEKAGTYSGPVETGGVYKKSMAEKVAPILVVALLVMAFGLGAMWSKIKYLESGQGGARTGGAAAGSSKYKSFEEAVKAYGKQVKLDDKKFMACWRNGDRKGVVEADLQEGASLGVQGTPGFFINGRFLGGAFPYSAFKEIIDKEIAGKGSTNYKDYSLALQQAHDAPSGKAFDPVPKQVEMGRASTKGPEEAKVLVIEYSDFQCPYCLSALSTIRQVLTDYGDQVRFAYKHFPLSGTPDRPFHKNAQKAAEAAECARDQGKFWEMHDLLFEKQQEWASL